MIWNVVSACELTSREAERREALEHGLALPADHTTDQLRLYRAFDLARAGDAQGARTELSRISAEPERGMGYFLFHFTKFLLRRDRDGRLDPKAFNEARRGLEKIWDEGLFQSAIGRKLACYTANHLRDARGGPWAWVWWVWIRIAAATETPLR
jgi:hypothetical protein